MKIKISELKKIVNEVISPEAPDYLFGNHVYDALGQLEQALTDEFSAWDDQVASSEIDKAVQDVTEQVEEIMNDVANKLIQGEYV